MRRGRGPSRGDGSDRRAGPRAQYTLARMDFDGFVADCRAEWRVFDDNRALAHVSHPHDRSLRPVLDAVQGMATENKLVLLNRAVARLAPGEVYVEVGCWQGLSLAGALHGHPAVAEYACGAFSEFGGPSVA